MPSSYILSPEKSRSFGKIHKTAIIVSAPLHIFLINLVLIFNVYSAIMYIEKAWIPSFPSSTLSFSYLSFLFGRSPELTGHQHRASFVFCNSMRSPPILSPWVNTISLGVGNAGDGVPSDCRKTSFCDLGCRGEHRSSVEKLCFSNFPKENSHVFALRRQILLRQNLRAIHDRPYNRLLRHAEGTPGTAFPTIDQVDVISAQAVDSSSLP